jgi:tripartite-type tricarboxylate transporter receptor subunit TctC
MAGMAVAQPGAPQYPAKIIRVINPAAPGGNSDLLFRTLAPKMVESLGQQLVMDTAPAPAPPWAPSYSQKAHPTATP